MEIVPIAILDDNYSYLVVDLATKASAVIDPSDPGTVQVCHGTGPSVAVTSLLCATETD